MPTYLPSSGSINLNGGDSRAINNIFGPANSVPAYGNNLLAYVGQRWYKADASTGVFTAPVTMPGDFYGKGPISPVTSGSYSISGSTSAPNTQSFTVPLYSFMVITLRGGAGGGGGGDGNVASGGSGATGGASSFAGGAYGSPALGGPGGAGGGGSTRAPSGAGSDGTPVGGSGGSSATANFNVGQPGGNGGKSVLTLYNPVPGNPTPYGPPVGASVSVTAGGGGAAGSGGSGAAPWPWWPYTLATESTGMTAGGSGSVTINWF
jgi:hypothetical protein